MRRGAAWLVAVLPVLIFSGAVACAQRKPRERKDQKTQPAVALPDEQAIEIAISEMLGAWQIGDVGMLHKYYADDVIVVSGAWEPPLMGWANFARAYRAQRARMEGPPRLERSNTYTIVRGNVAWVVYQWAFNAVVDGKPTSARGHTTLVLEKRKDRWVIVHNHTSLVPEPTPPQPAAPKPTPPGATGPGARG